MSSYLWTLKSTSLTAGKWSDLLKGKGKKTHLDLTGEYFTSVFLLLLSLVMQGKKDVSSGLFSPAALPRCTLRGLVEGKSAEEETQCFDSMSSEFTFLGWPRAWTSNQPPYPGLPSKTYGFPKHQRSPPWRRTTFGFKPDVQSWMTSAFNEPGRQHGLCGFKCRAGGLALASLPAPPAWWSTRLALLRAHLLGQAAAAQHGPQRDCRQGISTLAPNGNSSEAAWEEGQHYRGRMQAGLGSRALTAGLWNASAHHLHLAGVASPGLCHRLSAAAMSGV